MKQVQTTYRCDFCGRLVPEGGEVYRLEFVMENLRVLDEYKRDMSGIRVDGFELCYRCLRHVNKVADGFLVEGQQEDRVKKGPYKVASIN